MRKTTALAIAAVFLSLGATLPDEGPVPSQKPDTQEKAPGPEPRSKPDNTESPAEQPSEEPPAPAIEAENEASFIACQRELKAHGASFRSLPRVDDGEGCGIDKPIAVDRISETVRIVPEAILRCETALQLARWTRTVVTSASMTALPEKGRLTAINHASAYVCRKRNGAENGKISEHARGNAIDLASLEFEKGTVPMAIVTQTDSDLAAAFQRSLNATACLYFATVLSPGSDEAHQNHMHLDVIERSGGFRYCR